MLKSMLQVVAFWMVVGGVAAAIHLAITAAGYQP